MHILRSTCVAIRSQCIWYKSSIFSTFSTYCGVKTPKKTKPLKLFGFTVFLSIWQLFFLTQCCYVQHCASCRHIKSHMSHLISCCLHIPVLLAAQRRHVLSRRGEQPHSLSGGFGVAVVENQGLLHCEEGDRLVPHVRAGHSSTELALQGRAQPHCLVRALPLQNHHLTYAEET